MNTKLFNFLKDKCKDMGLSDKAITEFATAGSDGLTDDSTDEEVETSANRILPFAKTMQGEATRWAQTRPQTVPKTPPAGGNGDGGQNGSDDEPAWFKAYREAQDAKIKSLEDESTKMQADRAKEQRRADIAAEVKRLHIPEWRMKGVTIPDDADIKTVLTEIKQDLVTNQLIPADAAGEQGNSAQASREDAEAWAASLPNVQS